MDSLNLDGKVYVKASSIARDLGYTADYVGQLCRAGKVDAHLVGRSWYVSRDDLKSYKQDKRRSNAVKTKKEVEKILIHPDNFSKNATISNSLTSKSLFYKYAKKGNFKYEEDTSELIPILKKRSEQSNVQIKKLPIEMADAKNVRVKSEQDSYNLSFSKKPEVTFKGQVKVKQAEEAEAPFAVESYEQSLKDSFLARVEAKGDIIKENSRKSKEIKYDKVSKNQHLESKQDATSNILNKQTIKKTQRFSSSYIWLLIYVGLIFGAISLNLFIVQKITVKSEFVGSESTVQILRHVLHY